MKGPDTPSHGAPPAPRLSTETLLYLPAILAPAVTGLLTIVVLTRLLTPADYGHYALAMATATGVSAVLGDWMTATVIRFYPEFATHPISFIRRVGQLSVYTACFTIPVVVGLLAFVAPASYLVPAAALAGLYCAAKAWAGLIRAKLRTRLFTSVNVVGAVAVAALGIGSLVATRWPPSLIWANVVVSLGTVIVFARAASTRDDSAERDEEAQGLRSLLSFGMPLIVTALGSQILLIADRYLLEIFASTQAVGIYVPNYAMADRLMGFLFAPLFYALYPLATQAWARGDKTTSVAYLETAQRALLVVGGLACILLVIHAESVSEAIVGTEFAAGSGVIGIVAIGTLFWHQGLLFHQPLELEKRTAVITLQTLGAGALAIALNAIWIPAFGIEGAAWATLVSYAAYMMTSYMLTRRVTSKSARIAWSTWTRVVVCAATIALFASFLDMPAWAGALGAATFYVTFMLATREPAVAQVVEITRVALRRARSAQ